MKKNIAILFLTLTALSCTEMNNENKTGFSPAFAHTVYFWFNNPDSEADKAKFEASLTTFLNNSEYAKTKFIGRAPQASRDVVDGSFTYSLILSFESAEAQAKYQKEAPHLKFVEECSDLWEKVIVYDSTPIKKG